MQITIARDKRTTDGLFGVLSMDQNPFTAFSVENRALAIPVGGPYPVYWEYSPHFNRSMPHIRVPGRTLIMFHPANNPVGPNPEKPELKGCVGMGDRMEPDAVDNSRVTFNRFEAIIKDRTDVVVNVVERYADAA